MPPALSRPLEERKQLLQASGMALGAELLFFLALGLGHLVVFRSPSGSAQYVDAQILQLPPNAVLRGAVAAVPDDEIVYNPRRKHPKPVKKADPPPGQNQVKAAPGLGPTQGPVALYSPAPVIPGYLRNQNLKASVVIEFLITAQGRVTPRLLDSSGSGELDAIALDTASKWQFKPATRGDVPVDSKTRLRILFEVY